MRYILALLVGLGSATAAENTVIYASRDVAFGAMARDGAGNLYLTGTASAKFQATPGAYQTQYHNGSCDYAGLISACGDAFVMKLDPNGKPLFATLLGGNGSELGTAIALDATGNIHVAGSTMRNVKPNDFPVTSNALFPHPSQLINSSLFVPVDSFLAILSPDGKRLIYSTYLPGLTGVSLALDPVGNVYLAGNVEPEASAFQPRTEHFNRPFGPSGLRDL